VKNKLQYINLGCGDHFHEDWVNVDFNVTGRGVFAHNLNRGIPFQDDSFDVVYHSHLLEHFSKMNAELFIRECYRVLKENGIIRVVIPDLEQIIVEYQKQLNLAINSAANKSPNYNWIMLELFDQMVRNQSGGLMAEYILQEKLENEEYVFERIGYEAKNLRKFNIERNNIKSQDEKVRLHLKQKIKLGIKRFLVQLIFRGEYYEIENFLKIGKFRQSGENHQWMYDRYSLAMLLRENGFDKIEVKTAFESNIPDFSKFNLDVINGEIRKPDSLFMEARKKVEE
jgi:predicted SAM-dependent methyltransferase